MVEYYLQMVLIHVEPLREVSSRGPTEIYVERKFHLEQRSVSSSQVKTFPSVDSGSGRICIC